MALRLGENAVKAEIHVLRDKQIVMVIGHVLEILYVELTTAVNTSVIIIGLMIAVLLRARKEDTVRK